jgi:hypothetical protein
MADPGTLPRVEHIEIGYSFTLLFSRLFNTVILSGVKGLAWESLLGVERPAVCLRHRRGQEIILPDRLD